MPEMQRWTPAILCHSLRCHVRVFDSMEQLVRSGAELVLLEELRGPSLCVARKLKPTYTWKLEPPDINDGPRVDMLRVQWIPGSTIAYAYDAIEHRVFVSMNKGLNPISRGLVE